MQRDVEFFLDQELELVYIAKRLKDALALEKALTEACTARGDPCLAEGCAVEGEICLEACLAAGARYRDGCAAAWIDLFENPENRVDAWRR